MQISEEKKALYSSNFKLSHIPVPDFHAWHSTMRGNMGHGDAKREAQATAPRRQRAQAQAQAHVAQFRPQSATTLARSLLKNPVPPDRRGHLDGILENLPMSDADRRAMRKTVARHDGRWSSEMQRQCRDVDKFHFQKRDQFKDYVEARAKFSKMAGAKSF